MYRRYLLFFILCVLFVEVNSDNNYGSFELLVKKVKDCKGPKRRDCATANHVITGKSNIACNITVGENVPSIRGKVFGYLGNQEIVKVNLAKPCSHIFIKPILKLVLKITDRCVILKGYYQFTLDFEDLMRKYHGTAFVYGNWTYKSIFYNDECNFYCSIFQYIITPYKKH